MSKSIVKTVNVVFAFFLGILLLTIGIDIAEYITNGYISYILGVIILCLVFASLWLLHKKIKNFAKLLYYSVTNIAPWKLALILGGISAITKLFFVFLFDMNTDLHEDMQMYRSFAVQYAESGCITENIDYATWYKYTVTFGLILSPFAKIFGSDPKVFTSAFSILISIAIVLLFDIIKKYTGKEIAFVGLLIYTLFPFGLFQTQVLIHENGLLFFHILALWFYLKIFDKKYHYVIRGLCLLLSGISISIGKSINPSGQIIVFSFILYASVKIFKNGINIKKVYKFLCIVLVLATCFVGTSLLTDKIHENTVEKSPLKSVNMKAVPCGWQIYLGYNSEMNGYWNYEDYKTYYAFRDFDAQETANEYQITLIQERLQEYFDAPYKFIVLYFNKFKNLLAEPFLGVQYNFGNEANTFFLQGANGLLFKISILISYILNIYIYAILFISTLSNIKNKVFDINPSTHFKMSVIGITLVLLLICEVTQKYATHMHTLLFATALFYIKSYFNNSFIYNKSTNKYIH